MAKHHNFGTGVERPINVTDLLICGPYSAHCEPLNLSIMTDVDERPTSPVGRIAPVTIRYCQDRQCNDCKNLLDCNFCPKCSCQICRPGQPYISDNISYHNSSDEESKGKSFVKRKSGPQSLAPQASPLKRIKTKSVSTETKQLVSEAASSAINLPALAEVGPFCLVTLAHGYQGCLETCHIVPWALSDENVRFISFLFKFQQN